jgi:hypothetical protein
VTNPDGTHSLATSNAQGAKVYGVESELSANFTKDDTIQLERGLHAYPPGVPDRGQQRLFAAGLPGPEDQQLPGRHRPPPAALADRLRTGLATSTRSASRSGSNAVPARRVPLRVVELAERVQPRFDGDLQKSYTRTDLGLRYSSMKQWYADAYVQNVEDGRIKTNAQNSFGVWQSQYLPPRTFGVNVGILRSDASRRLGRLASLVVASKHLGVGRCRRRPPRPRSPSRPFPTSTAPRRPRCRAGMRCIRTSTCRSSYADHHTAMTTAIATGANLPDVMAIDMDYLGKFTQAGGSRT